MTKEELKKLREDLKWTQRELADYLHITRGQVAKLESGECSIRGAVEQVLEGLAKHHPS